MLVRAAIPEDHERLIQLWERSVRATHDFLGDSDIVALRPLVAAQLATSTTQWWALWSTNNELAGLLGYSPDTIGALFVDPEYRRLGGGRTLVAFARDLASGREPAVEVNEQNDQAVRFYRALGFSTIERDILQSILGSLRAHLPRSGRIPARPAMRGVGQCGNRMTSFDREALMQRRSSSRTGMRHPRRDAGRCECRSHAIAGCA